MTSATFPADVTSGTWLVGLDVAENTPDLQEPCAVLDEANIPADPISNSLSDGTSNSSPSSTTFDPRSRSTATTTNSSSVGGSSGRLFSLFEKEKKMEITPSGRTLPAEYLKGVRSVIAALRESLSNEVIAQPSKHREQTEAAKEAIRRYLVEWRGKRLPDAQEIDAAIETALRRLSTFYSKNGPLAAISPDARDSVLGALRAAEAQLL